MIRFLTGFSANILQIMPKPEQMFYAVKRGRVPGIYSSWSECEKQVKGFTNPAYKKFGSHEDALGFITQNGTSTSQSIDQQNFNHGLEMMKISPITTSCISSDSSQRITGVSSAISACCPCTLSTFNIASLSSTVENMKDSMKNIVGVVEKLSVELAEVRSSVSNLEKNLFVVPGSKRSFSTSAMHANNEDQAKRPKFDCKVDHFTGKKFDQSDGTHVYTDGGCFDNGRNGARAGIGVFWAKNDPDNVSERLSGRPTNNRAEIHAAVRAIQIAKRKGILNLILHTDSQFLINGITKWIRGWKRNQWKKATGSPVINQQDFEELDRELRGINVKWVRLVLNLA
uniref:Ribonuclease H1 n=1 Tax=Arion vulgaris TaxID=1028688 RepID=A0A0B6ZQH1_9EUPU